MLWSVRSGVFFGEWWFVWLCLVSRMWLVCGVRHSLPFQSNAACRRLIACVEQCAVVLRCWLGGWVFVFVDSSLEIPAGFFCDVSFEFANVWWVLVFFDWSMKFLLGVCEC